jgi:hypothetical protein
LAARYPKGTKFRSGSAIPEIKALQDRVDGELRGKNPGLRDNEPFEFRIWTKKEYKEKIKGSAHVIIK